MLGNTISGLVKDLNGDPVANATIAINGVNQTQTSDAGIYEVTFNDIFPPLEYTIEAIKEM